MDLRAGYEFTKFSDRQRARREIGLGQPFLLITSPECKWWSSIVNMSYGKMDQRDIGTSMVKARIHLEFVAQLHLQQVRGGRHLLSEHPASASSWRDPSVQKVLLQTGAYIVTMGQPQHGRTTTTPDRRVCQHTIQPNG